MTTNITSIPHVRTRLPDEGLDAFLDRPWHPLVNAFDPTQKQPQSLTEFPLQWAVMAPNYPEFLTALGRPLAIARDLESKPGIWWLSTPDDKYDFIIFSDCHRKNPWKGKKAPVESPGNPPQSNRPLM